ncbi:MAG: conserved hypothetical alanine-rich protein [uncultured Frankineae bacterium]|uniref:Conserved hypothetical alanine-rich protein n=1 Tax=uncultured Frankineae bacterium TaxID=437475 RepID=A0A6J4LAI7_9ACTN|nr:MAG: conserved hypothetical alanine-rich protein [uncultured Frankineae bacterium]
MPSALVHAYPWDFAGPAASDPAAARAVELGVTAVAVAASYHATRAAGPLHPSRPLVEAEHAACYVPVRPSAWAGRRLVPRSPTWVDSPDSFGSARRSLAAAGLETHAWVVLTHNRALGGAHPDLVVRNAFGHAYPYALCPSAPDVVEYCTTLVEEVQAAGPVDGLVLEACGPMGFEHNGPHDKTGLAGWTATQRALLSLCFCTACTGRYADAGADVAEARSRVRQAITPGGVPCPPPVPDSVERALGADLAGVLHGVRSAATAGLRRQVLARAGSGVRVTLHADPDPWARGSFAPVAPALEDPVDALVASCVDVDAGVRSLPELRALGGPDVALGALVQPTRDWADADVVERIDRLRSAGAVELHLYHLGLVGPAGHALLRRMAEAFLSAR